MRQCFKTRTPALRVNHLNELWSTDTIFSHVEAIGGHTCAQVYAGKTSKSLKVHGMHTESEFPDSLKDFIIQVGAPHTLMSDNANAEASKEVLSIPREHGIKARYSEPYKENQNYVERPIQNLKRDTMKLLDRTGVPVFLWLQAMECLADFSNCMAHESLGWIAPKQKSTGVPPDVSHFTKHHFYEPILCFEKGDNHSYPNSAELLGWWLGPSGNVGDVFCSKILTTNNQIIHRSVIRSAHGHPLHANKRQADGEAAVLTGGDEPTLLSNKKDDEIENVLPDIDPHSIIGYEFVHKIGEHGCRAKVTECLEEEKKCIVSIGDGNMEEILACNEMMDAINKRMDDAPEDSEQLWFFESIADHKLTPDKKSCLVKVRWSTGEETWEPLNIMAEDDPVTCAKHAKEHNLLDYPGWKRFKCLAAREKKFVRMLRQAYASKKRNAPKCMFGVRIPRDCKEAIELDKANGNTFWQDAKDKEVSGHVRSFVGRKDYLQCLPVDYEAPKLLDDLLQRDNHAFVHFAQLAFFAGLLPRRANRENGNPFSWPTFAKIQSSCHQNQSKYSESVGCYVALHIHAMPSRVHSHIPCASQDRLT
jgi:hypothetical protein